MNKPYTHGNNTIVLQDKLLSDIISEHSTLMGAFYDRVEAASVAELTALERDLSKFSTGNCEWSMFEYLTPFKEIVNDELLERLENEEVGL